MDSYAKDGRPACSASPIEIVDSSAQAKRNTLDAYLNNGTKPSNDFITSPPFIDSSGFSYAYFLTKKGLFPYTDIAWIMEHLSFYKASELKEILTRYQLHSLQFDAIADFSEAEIKDLVQGTPLLLTKNYLLIKNQSRLGFSPLSYWVYDVRDLHSELKNGSYDLVTASTDAYCLERIGNACWTYNSKTALAYLFRYSLSVLILLAVGFLVFLGFYLKYIFEKNREQQKHRLSIQVLSHEFRTPVSSMLLLIEQLAKNPQRFSTEDQDLITRASTEIFRLQRIIEMSRNYLQAEDSRTRFTLTRISSINAWISDFMAEFDPSIRFNPLQNDQSIHADVFWLKFVLSNLVQNAVNHGQAPISVRLDNSTGAVKISVEDQGQCEFDSLKQMAEPFVKSQKSKGMGLGLNITKFIVDEWGSRLEFTKNPTAFTLSLNRANQRGSNLWPAS